MSRLLGMGDVLSLIERAEQAIDTDDAARIEQKLRGEDFTLEDFAAQLKTLRKMGPLEQVLGMLPGHGQSQAARRREARRRADAPRRGDHQLDDAGERRNYKVIDGSRRRRIARGSGTTVEDVNRLLKQFVQMRKMLKMVGAWAVVAASGCVRPWP